MRLAPLFCALWPRPATGKGLPLSHPAGPFSSADGSARKKFTPITPARPSQAPPKPPFLPLSTACTPEKMLFDDLSQRAEGLVIAQRTGDIRTPRHPARSFMHIEGIVQRVAHLHLVPPHLA